MITRYSTRFAVINIVFAAAIASPTTRISLYLSSRPFCRASSHSNTYLSGCEKGFSFADILSKLNEVPHRNRVILQDYEALGSRWQHALDRKSKQLTELKKHDG